jgi:hypothetical protein
VNDHQIKLLLDEHTNQIAQMIRATAPAPPKKRYFQKWGSVVGWVGFGGVISILVFTFTIGARSSKMYESINSVEAIGQTSQENNHQITKHLQVHTTDLDPKINEAFQTSREIYQVLAYKLGNRVHQVREGESFAMIAQNLGVSIDELRRLNPHIQDVAVLTPGTRIFYVMEANTTMGPTP